MVTASEPSLWTPADLADALLAQSDRDRQGALLAAALPAVDPAAVVETLRLRLRAVLHAELQQALHAARTITHVGRAAGDDSLVAIGFWAEATVYTVSLGEHAQALALYDEAIQRLRAAGDELSLARLQLARVWALACVGRRDDAITDGEAAALVLQAHERWADLAALRNNLAAVHNRAGDYSRALAMLEEVRAAYRRLGADGAAFLPQCELNRALALTNLGRLEEAIAAGEETIDLARAQGQNNVVAQAQANLGRIFFVLGHYTRALTLFDQAQAAFDADGRERDALLTRLTATDCYLELRRFHEVLNLSRDVRAGLLDLDLPLEAAQAARNEALAYAGLALFDEALGALQTARAGFAAIDNAFWLAFTDLEIAGIHLRQGDFAAAQALALACETVFAAAGGLVEAALAQILAARAALELGEPAEAARWAGAALRFAAAEDVPQLAFQAQDLLGRVAARRGDRRAAIEHFDAAIAVLERLQGRVIVEYRADFLEDKGRLYERMVALQLEENRPALALDYAERAKSRALLDLLTHRLRLQVSARVPGDEPLVESLNRLRDERDRLLRAAEGGERGPIVSGDEPVRALEQRITSLWHKLLERNADYAREATLWQVHTESAQPYLDDDTLLLEYFEQDGRLLLFLVTAADVRVIRLGTTVSVVQQWLQRLWLNLRSVNRTPPGRVPALTANACAVLQRLNDLVLGAAAQELRRYSNLIIVPHGSLHYLPFAALHDGSGYLLERHALTFLPGASFLGACLKAPRADGGLLALGHSYGGALPHAAAEAVAVADRSGGAVLLETEATRAALSAMAFDRRVLHLATHGEFRPDNPLFSGLALADGWLTTLDIFNLPLRASLVTLSACQTGRSVVGGGDELRGLMRAFLSAGAASLVGTHWAVDDRSTALLMDHFYGALDRNVTKAMALRDAQLALWREADPRYAHPYYWAPFFLVGDGGPL